MVTSAGDTVLMGISDKFYSFFNKFMLYSFLGVEKTGLHAYKMISS